MKAANSELCTKMREMIQELDQEKQEAAERSHIHSLCKEGSVLNQVNLTHWFMAEMCCVCRAERTQQQYRDDVVNRVRAELTQEHTAHMEQLASQHQQHIQQLQYCTTPSPLT